MIAKRSFQMCIFRSLDATLKCTVFYMEEQQRAEFSVTHHLGGQAFFWVTPRRIKFTGCLERGSRLAINCLPNSFNGFF